MKTPLEFRDVFAKMVAASATERLRWDDIFIANLWDQSGEDERHWTLAWILHSEEDSRNICAEGDKFHLNPSDLLVAWYRPRRPEPDVRDVMRAAEIGRGHTFRSTWNAERGNGAHTNVNLWDFIIVDADGGWKSVFDVAGLHAATWCPHCEHRVFAYGFIDPLEVVDVPDSEWDDLTYVHKLDCPWVAAKGEMETMPARNHDAMSKWLKSKPDERFPARLAREIALDLYKTPIARNWHKQAERAERIDYDPETQTVSCAKLMRELQREFGARAKQEAVSAGV